MTTLDDSVAWRRHVGGAKLSLKLAEGVAPLPGIGRRLSEIREELQRMLDSPTIVEGARCANPSGEFIEPPGGEENTTTTPP